MVFGRDGSVGFPLSSKGTRFWTTKRPMAKGQLMEEIRRWKCRGPNVTLKHVIWGWQVAECIQMNNYAMPEEMDELVSDLAELSLTHTVAFVGVDELSRDDCIAVVKSEDSSTNMDADVMDALIGKFHEASTEG